MGKFRSKLKGQTKGKRWPKGQSSSSNPATSKYRDLAKSRFFQENLGPSNLTSDALRQHDVISSDVPPTTAEPSDTESEVSTYKTMQSFASDWSECSNTSFSHLLNNFKPKSVLHKEMLSVLAAVTEVIKQSGGTETATEYYAALMTTLEVTESEVDILAVLTLLEMVIKSVPKAVLQAQFAPAIRMYKELRERCVLNEETRIRTKLMGFLAAQLQAQEPAAWLNYFTKDLVEDLTSNTLRDEPKVRRAALKGLCELLESEENHPAATHVVNYYILHLDLNIGDSQFVLQALRRLGRVIAGLPAAPLRRFIEHVLAQIATSKDTAACRALRVIHALCSSPRPTALSVPHTARMVTALLELQPPAADTQTTQAWLATVAVALVYLADLDRNLAVASLPRAFTALTALWLSERAPLMTATTHAMHTLLEDCMGPTTDIESLDRVYTILRSCFGYQYHKAWHLVLHVHATAFRCAPRDAAQRLVGPTLHHLAEIRDSYNFSYNNELEFAVGAAIKALGPELVLSVITLKNEDGSVNLDRSWLLPVLKENVQCSTLEYFGREILPLGAACESQAKQLAQNNDGVGAHSYELLAIQCWSLLPSFCRHATDVRQNFRHVAKTLGSAISERKELRLFVMSALRKLIQNSAEEEEDKVELARFAKNFLPILFNLYTTTPVGTDEEGQRLAALDTVCEYLKIAPLELTRQLFENALNSLNVKTDAFTRESILDLMRCLAVHQTSEALGRLYTQCIHPILLDPNTNKKEQKKGYRLLEDICSSEAEPCRDFIETNHKKITSLVVRGLVKTATCSRAARLRVQGALLRATNLVHHDHPMLRSALPEAVMSLTEPSARARASAQALLLIVAEALEARRELPQLASLLLAGLAGDTNLVRPTIHALALLTQHYVSALGPELVKLFVDAVVLLTTSSTRDVVAACLHFFKIYIASVPTPIIAHFLPDIMKAITTMTRDCEKHFRLRVRDILDKLMRKFGAKALATHVAPTNKIMLKRLRNLRKMQQRKKRRRNQEDDDKESDDDDAEFTVRPTSITVQDILADSSDEDSEDKPDKVQHKKKRKNTNTWIKEDIDYITDLTREGALNTILHTFSTSTNPEKSNKPKSERGFKTSSDGRLIIQDLESDSASEESEAAPDSEEELAVRKRKRVDPESVCNTYKTGGKGIHRPIKNKKTERALEPYAYLPLKKSKLNKRRGADATFKELLNKRSKKKND